MAGTVRGAWRKLAKRLGRPPALAVSEARGVRTLHVGGEAIQSAMRIDDPFALALDYTRLAASSTDGLSDTHLPKIAVSTGLPGAWLAEQCIGMMPFSGRR